MNRLILIGCAFQLLAAVAFVLGSWLERGEAPHLQRLLDTSDQTIESQRKTIEILQGEDR